MCKFFRKIPSPITKSFQFAEWQTFMDVTVFYNISQSITNFTYPSLTFYKKMCHRAKMFYISSKRGFEVPFGIKVHLVQAKGWFSRG